MCLYNTSNRHYQQQTFYQPEVKGHPHLKWKKLQKNGTVCSFAMSLFFDLKTFPFSKIKE